MDVTKMIEEIKSSTVIELSELVKGYSHYLKLAYLHGLITSKELVEKKRFLKSLEERFKAHGLRIKFIEHI